MLYNFTRPKKHNNKEVKVGGRRRVTHAVLTAVIDLVVLAVQERLMLSASALSFAVPSLRTSAAYAGSPSSVRFVSRTYTPFDPNEKAAYGMGAAEKFSYDPEHAYAYVATDRGYISVIDYSAPVASVTSLGVSLGKGLTARDLRLCGESLYVVVGTIGKRTEPGALLAFSRVTRAAPASLAQVWKVGVGPGPDSLLPSPDCKTVAVRTAARRSPLPAPHPPSPPRPRSPTRARGSAPAV